MIIFKSNFAHYQTRLLSLLALYFLATACLFSRSIFAQESDWHLYKKNRQTSVYYRELNSKPLLEIKTQTRVKSTLSGFMHFLQDYDNIPNWMDNANGSQLITQITPQHNIFRTQFSAIWPVSPREMIIQSRFWQDNDGKLHIYVSDASNYHAVHKKHIAIRVHQANWQIIPLDQNMIEINYRFIADANGKVPYWLANRMALSSIWQTLVNIQQQLPISPWQQAKLMNIKEYNEISR